MRKIYLLLFVPLVIGTAQAQEDTTKAKELGEVVVTGQYKPQSVKNSVYQVKVITRERIEKQGANNLQDVLKNELNIRFSQDLATGGADISMLGLQGQNVKILLDGMPMIGRQGTSNEININQIDINSIERIEIVEGPMSVIYGADALAGVINIITKKSSRSKISVNARVREESVGKEYGFKQGIHNQNLGLSLRHRNWEIGGGIGRNYFGGWKDSAVDRELLWHKKDQILGNAFLGYSNGNFNIRYRFDGLDEIITNPGNFINIYDAAADTLAYDQEYLTHRVMQQLQASYFVNSSLSFQAQAAYTDFSRQVFSTTVSKNTGKTSLNIAPGSQTMDEFNGFTFRGTALYRASKMISFQPGVDINLESGKGQRLKAGTNKVNDYAFFITSEISPTSKISIRPGLRFISNSVYDAPPVVPSINTKFVLTKNLDLRLAYARGFRAPSLRELYFNFFDASHQIVGNPDLKAETSNSITGSLSWRPALSQHGISYEAVLTGFYNDVKNLITIPAVPNSQNEFMYINIATYKTRGGSLNFAARSKNWLASIGTSVTGFYNDLSEEDKSLPEFQWSAEINSNLGYNFSKIGLDVNFFYKFTGKKPAYTVSGSNIVLTELEGYHMADLTFTKTIVKFLKLDAGIRNLFDVDRINSSIISSGSHGSGGGVNIGYGRSYFAGLIFNWDKK